MGEHAYRELIGEIINLAVKDSIGLAGAREQARHWLESSPYCEFYCVLIGLDRQAMLDRLRRVW